MKTLKPGQKQWGHPTKVAARQQTIIEPYRALFGKKIPADLQYWTLCGELALGTDIQPNCELDHMVRAGIITPQQFHGVELNPDIHAVNTKATRKAPYNKAKLYQGEFTQVLDQALGEGLLAPGIVYLDTISEPKYGADMLSQTMAILNEAREQADNCYSTLLVWNIIIGHRRRNRHYSWDAVAKEVLRKGLTLSETGWQHYGEEVYSYPGTGRSCTTMGTVVFYQEAIRATQKRAA